MKEYLLTAGRSVVNVQRYSSLSLAPSCAVIPGATVEAANVGTGVKTSRQTTLAGYFVLSSLPAGEYSVRVSATGFETLVQAHVIVDALSSTSMNPAMRIGSTSEQVTISDTPAVLNTADASVSQTVRNDVYTALPLTMGTGGASINSPRDPTAFVAIMPGVSGYGGNTAGTVFRKVGAFAKVCGWAWRPVAVKCRTSRLAAGCATSDLGRSDSEKGQ